MVCPEQRPPARLLQAGTGREVMPNTTSLRPEPPPALVQQDTYRGFGFGSFGFLEPRFGGIQV